VVIDFEKRRDRRRNHKYRRLHRRRHRFRTWIGVTSNGRENKAGIVDLKNVADDFKSGDGTRPGRNALQSGQQEAYLFCGAPKSATVIDVKGGKVVATIPLGGRPDSRRLTRSRSRLRQSSKTEVA